MPPGTYTLILELARPATITFGAAGDRDLQDGYYAYTGSAFGPGGLSRVDRHRELATGERTTRHWHVDYLLGHPASSLVATATTQGADRECAVARALERECSPVPGLGASDCSCGTHLVYHENRTVVERAADAAHA